MKKLHLNGIISAIVAVFVFGGLAVPEAQAMMSRGIYVNGKVHYITFTTKDKSGHISHKAYVPNNKGILPYDPNLVENGYQVDICNPDPGHRSVMNGAVFDQKIFFVFTGHPQASGTSKTCNYSSGTHLYVTYWDLTTPSWTTGFAKDLGLLYHQNTIDKKDNPTDMASAAIVVFNGLLYVFSDAGTYTSSDGVNWSPHPGLPGNDSNLQPLDAITYYPPRCRSKDHDHLWEIG